MFSQERVSLWVLVAPYRHKPTGAAIENPNFILISGRVDNLSAL